MNPNLFVRPSSSSSHGVNSVLTQPNKIENKVLTVPFGETKMSTGQPTASLIRPEIKNFSRDQEHTIAFLTGLVGEEEPSHTAARAIYQTYQERLAFIEQEKLLKIEEAQQQMNRKEMSASQGGIGASARAVRNELKQAFQAKKEVLEKEAQQKAFIATVEMMRDFLPYQEKAFCALLDQRLAQLRQNIEVTVSNDQEKQNLKIEAMRQMVTTAFEKKRNIFKTLEQDPVGATEEKWCEVFEKSLLIDAVCIKAFNIDAHDYIDGAMRQLRQVEHSLGSIAQWAKENKFSIHKWVPQLQKILDQCSTSFSLAEALSPDAAATAARKNATSLRKEIEALTAAIVQSDQAKDQARSEDHDALLNNKAGLEQLHKNILLATAAYNQIAGEYGIRIQEKSSLPNQHSRVPQHEHPEIFEVTQTLPEVTKKEDQDDVLKELLDTIGFSLAEKKPLEKSFDLHFLAHLDQLSEAVQSHAVCGYKNKITLMPLSGSFSDSERTLFLQGVHLIRLAIFRNFGLQGIRHFDWKLHDTIQAKNPLTVKELKELVQVEASANAGSFYLSPTHALSELQFQWEDESNDSRVIRSEKISFNPFSHDDYSLQTPLSLTQSAQEGIKTARKALRELFHDVEVTKKAATFARFDNSFKRNKMPLTLGALKSFIEEESTKGSWYLSAPLKNNIIWHAFLSIHNGIKNSQWFLHSGIWPPMIMSLVIGITGDLTGRSRQLEPPSEEEES